MKYFVTIVLVLIALITGLIFFKGRSDVVSRVDKQVLSINAQVADFEALYNKCKETGEQYYNDIITTCLYNQVTDNFRALYVPSEDEHYGEINFCKTIDENGVWDSYDVYIDSYVESKGIEERDLWVNVERFNQKYGNLEGEEYFKTVELLDGSENYSTFKFINPEIKSIDFFGEMGSDVITEIIQVDCNQGFTKMTILLLWQDGKIIYAVRRI